MWWLQLCLQLCTYLTFTSWIDWQLGNHMQFLLSSDRCRQHLANQLISSCRTHNAAENVSQSAITTQAQHLPVLKLWSLAPSFANSISMSRLSTSILSDSAASIYAPCLWRQIESFDVLSYFGRIKASQLLYQLCDSLFCIFQLPTLSSTTCVQGEPDLSLHRSLKIRRIWGSLYLSSGMNVRSCE